METNPKPWPVGRRWDPDGESEAQRSLYGLTNPYCKDMWLIHEPKNKGGYWFRNKRSDTQRIGMHWYLKGVIMCNMGGRQNLGDLNHESNSKAMAVNHLVIAWHDFSPPKKHDDHNHVHTSFSSETSIAQAPQLVKASMKISLERTLFCHKFHQGTWEPITWFIQRKLWLSWSKASW